jgi:hypothetical protein
VALHVQMIWGSAFESMRKSALGIRAAAAFFEERFVGDAPPFGRPARAAGFFARRPCPRRLIELLVGKERVP